jgi:FRG domain
MEEIRSINTIIEKNFPPKTSKGTRFLYRGMSDLNFKFIPKISRTKTNEIADLNSIKDRYSNLNEYLKTFLPSYGLSLPPYGPLRDWIELFHAQHYGAPTNLLDFSRNPLVALYFAAYKDSDKDGLLYRISTNSLEFHTIDKLVKKQYSPYPVEAESNERTLSKITFIDPPHENSRIRSQHSILCYVPIDLSNKPLNLSNDLKFESFKISKSDKEEIIRELHMVGFNDFTLFPDIRGFGDYLAWKIPNRFPGI